MSKRTPLVLKIKAMHLLFYLVRSLVKIVQMLNANDSTNSLLIDSNDGEIFIEKFKEFLFERKIHDGCTLKYKS